MHVILYLSGEIGKSKQWHDIHDSIAGQVAIPRRLEKDFSEQLFDCGVIEDLSPAYVLPHVECDLIEDMCSDIMEDGIDDPFFDIARRIIGLCHSEFSCGYLHIRK